MSYKKNQVCFMIPENLEIIFTNYLSEVQAHKNSDWDAFVFAFNHFVIEPDKVKML